MPAGIKVLSKRIDLAGEAPPEPLKLTNGATTVLPGRYLLSFAPNAAYVPTDFRGCRGERPESDRADGWIEIAVLRPCGNRYVVSTKPGGVHGLVTSGAHDPVPGAPVFLEPYDEITRKRVVDLRSVISDIHGQFQFFGLVARHVSSGEHVRVPGAVGRRYRCDESARLPCGGRAGSAAGSRRLGDPVALQTSEAEAAIDI